MRIRRVGVRAERARGVGAALEARLGTRGDKRAAASVAARAIANGESVDVRAVFGVRQFCVHCWTSREATRAHRRVYTPKLRPRSPSSARVRARRVDVDVRSTRG